MQSESNEIKNKSEILSRIMDNIETTKKEKGTDYYINKQKEAVEKLTLAYQFGYMIGDEIVRRYLPSLTCISMIETNVEYKVTDEEKAIFRSLEDKWYDTQTKEDFDNQLNYYKSLERKYFPHTLRCTFDCINVPEESKEDFIRGIQSALWDCDCCSYAIKNLSDIVMYNTDDWYFTMIELKLDV